MFDISKTARPNILCLEPYHCARDDFQEGILLDANENTYGPSFTEMSSKEKAMELNRYPDPHQLLLKQRLCDFRNMEMNESFIKSNSKLTTKNVCLTVGSDGGIDLVMRCFARPGKEKILVCPPTYPMYFSCACLNDLGVVYEPLDKKTFQIYPQKILADLRMDPSIKLVFITSPGNPTAQMIRLELIWDLIHGVEEMSWHGLVILDEAYIDFCPQGSSLATRVNEHKNLVVLQTFSKSFALAGIRLGTVYSSPEVSSLLNIARDPYSQNKDCCYAALKATSQKAISMMKLKCNRIAIQRSLVLERLSKIKGIGTNVGGENANFILAQVLNKEGKPDSKLAYQVYWKMATEKKIVIRFRGRDLNCEGCLRITIGTHEENALLLANIEKVLSSLQ